ncbi:bifunctional (p)ppGpp synthetase/guanosine-3',5'-bis(diphosphate) 3'-pyrophosphohydrolase [Siccirubricoccus sp. KC 17139]|uniref:GTP pyrophosphokinase rsh n=1 Tax=Siccirubricoccus soli TaxID=2899147 RepID=A0ABT1DAE7_9PROT|nr:bifunctional (p)ppGpp synthetase/guanosine-3',5'-bis(diphosphate) 3'-pyrophosphohydrolase [Siccirubricoccus soli]MCP2685046.1 bifunctional (p)ppGpp synthetase/guanosine-3',5'-bis(diphosphate) 3'-pyrophosphohydrolase [Siccirubricoccus soli]
MAAPVSPPGLAEVAALVQRVAAYDPRADLSLLERAGRVAAEAHATQQRENGDPYITHPLAVAGILADYRLDSATIATALLHDVAEDTAVGLKEIERQFGPEVARLVDGVTKLTRIELQSERTKQAENLRKLVLAMSEDIRVLLVKLADRLHNMRTLHFVPQPARRQKTARETMEIFAPLAERIGMDALKTELETLAFQELHPEARQTIAARLTFLRGQGADLIREIEQDLRRVLAKHGVAALDVTGREKSPYSIWRKMQKKNVAFEALSDVMAFRVLVEDRAACYVALGAVHDAYRVVPGRFKDYISTPKTNGYQSLHTGVTVPERRNAKIEVQIRTREMHEVAEYGVAAHWIYKQGPEGQGSRGRRYPWVRALLDILENAEGAQEFLDHTKLELHRDLVFCFSPKGDLIELPRGATPVDFAYEVHSQVGDTCVGAKVNGKIVPLRHQLENGDQVEIITARGGQPNPAWERFVVTGKARARIRRFVHARQKEENRESGRSAIVRAFRQEGLDATEKLLEGALKPLKQPGLEELYTAVGAGTLSPKEVLHAAVPELRIPPRAADPSPLVRPRARIGASPLLGRPGGERGRASGLNAIPITGLVSGMPYHFAGCCHPLPGERIVGIVTTGKGVTIHAADCHTLENFAATPERFLDVDWDETVGGGRIGRIIVETRTRSSALAALTECVAQQDGAVTGLKVQHRDAESLEVALDVEVTDLRHLERIMAALRAPADNLRVERARG